jgi:hypothetical protein
VHQIAEGAKLLQGFLHRRLNLLPELHLPIRAGFGLEAHQVQVRGDQMLRGRVVQFLGDALALFLLKVEESLGQLLSFLLQRLALGDVGHYSKKTRCLSPVVELVGSIDL